MAGEEMNVDSAQLLVAGIVPIGVMIALTLLWKARRERARRETVTGDLVLEYGAAIKSAPILVTLIWAVIIPMVLHDDPIRGENLTAFLLLAVLITIPLVVTTIEAFGVAHRIRQQEIEKRSPWSSSWSTKWEEVDQITFNGLMQWFVVSSPQGNLRLHLYLNGLRDFAEAVRAKVPHEKWAKAEPHLNRLLN